MFDEADLRLTVDDSKQYKNRRVFRKAHRPLLPGLDDAAILSEIDPATVERPRRPGQMTRRNEQKLPRWVYLLEL